MRDTHTGTCLCGAVEIEVTGTPEGMGYCHCSSCRSWSASPVNAFILWPTDRVRVTRGEEFVGRYNLTDRSDRQFFTKCGGHLMVTHPHWGLIDVFAATTPSVDFVPQLHANYAETVMRMHDGLPKLRDFPAEMGGSGDLLPE